MISSTPIHNLRNRFASFALKPPKKYTRDFFATPREKKRKCVWQDKSINIQFYCHFCSICERWELQCDTDLSKIFFIHCCQRDNCVNCEWVSHGTHSLFFCHIWHVGVSNSGYLPIWQSNCLCHLLFLREFFFFGYAKIFISLRMILVCRF